MEVYTSYFYQVRNMNPNIVPLSTAVGDPAWYHAGLGLSCTFVDKNGVLNGMRAEPFRPGIACNGLCRGRANCASADPQTFAFLKTYRAQLDKLAPPAISQYFKSIASWYEQTYNQECKALALLFHEAPTNPCSERVVVQQWFRDNGYDIQEWRSSEVVTTRRL